MTSRAELTLEAQLDIARIPYDREYRFHPERRWRFDFAWPSMKMAVEIEGGSFTGGHKRGKAYESDCDKHNEATRLGWQVYRFTPAQVDDARALRWIMEIREARERAA